MISYRGDQVRELPKVRQPQTTSLPPWQWACRPGHETSRDKTGPWSRDVSWFSWRVSRRLETWEKWSWDSRDSLETVSWKSRDFDTLLLIFLGLGLGTRRLETRLDHGLETSRGFLGGSRDVSRLEKSGLETLEIVSRQSRESLETLILHD